MGGPVIVPAVFAQHDGLQPLATLSFCLGTSAIVPALVYSLFWRRCTRAGLLCTLIGGTLSVLVLMTGTDLVSGTPQSAFPGAHFNWFPSTTTAHVSVPAGFVCGLLGTVLSGRGATARERDRYEAIEHLPLAGLSRTTNG